MKKENIDLIALGDKYGRTSVEPSSKLSKASVNQPDE